MTSALSGFRLMALNFTIWCPRLEGMMTTISVHSFLLPKQDTYSSLNCHRSIQYPSHLDSPQHIASVDSASKLAYLSRIIMFVVLPKTMTSIQAERLLFLVIQATARATPISDDNQHMIDQQEVIGEEQKSCISLTKFIFGSHISCPRRSVIIIALPGNIPSARVIPALRSNSRDHDDGYSTWPAALYWRLVPVPSLVVSIHHGIHDRVLNIWNDQIHLWYRRCCYSGCWT